MHVPAAHRRDGAGTHGSWLHRATRQPGTLYQVSTLQGLMAGAFDGVVTFGELRRHGDLGIGTLQGLDGEMILLDGQAWQARADGQVVRVADQQTTPFATVVDSFPRCGSTCEGRRICPH